MSVGRLKGKGFEDERNYAGIRFHFLNVENIHVMRKSLAQLIEGIHSLPLTSPCWPCM